MIIVLKFGGTSLATQKQREDIARKIKKELKDNPENKILVVVSAMGRKGENYATDTLLSLVDGKTITKDKQDLLVSCGETISAAVLGGEFDKIDIPNKIVTGWNMGLITDDNFSEAKIKDVNPKLIQEIFTKYPVIIATGFQGVSSEGELTTLGRGGSDLSAVVLGIALEAGKVIIYTDVEGIMTADPRVVPDAKILDEITYQEIFHMANDGAKVIHPKAVEMAMKHDINLWIKSLNSDEKGTLITHHKTSKDEKWESKRIVTGITNIDGLTHFKIFTENGNSKKDLELLECLANKGISLDLISITPCIKAFVVEERHTDKVIESIEKYQLQYERTNNCTKVTVVGVSMKGKPGVMARILHPLAEENIPVIQTSDSHINISILVESKFSEKSLNILHSNLIGTNKKR